METYTIFCTVFILLYVSIAACVFGSLNQLLNGNKEEQYTKDIWCKNRTIALISSVFLTIPLLLWFLYSTEVWEFDTIDIMNFNIIWHKKDPLYYQIISENSVNIWDDSIKLRMKSNWGSI